MDQIEQMINVEEPVIVQENVEEEIPIKEGQEDLEPEEIQQA